MAIPKEILDMQIYYPRTRLDETAHWTKVSVHDGANTYFLVGDEWRVTEWLKEHTKGEYFYHWGEARFELASDATFFKLGYVPEC